MARADAICFETLKRNGPKLRCVFLLQLVLPALTTIQLDQLQSELPTLWAYGEHRAKRVRETDVRLMYVRNENELLTAVKSFQVK